MTITIIGGGKMGLPVACRCEDGLRTAAVYLRERRFLTPSRQVWLTCSVSQQLASN
jgi:hypothetical protein